MTVHDWNDPTLASEYNAARGEAAVAKVAALCTQVFAGLAMRAEQPRGKG